MLPASVSLYFLITCSVGRQLSYCEDTQVALWSGALSKELRLPPSNQQGTEEFCQQPRELVILEVNPPASVKPMDDSASQTTARWPPHVTLCVKITHLSDDHIPHPQKL